LETSNKTEENIKEEYRNEAEKRAKFEIVLKEIFKVEGLNTNPEDVEKQVQNIAQMHQDVDLENVRLYVENIMINEEVMKFLETL
jgi:FKBP-type peptidyl-prolyl cis-trans isomerase (trigger factor)